MSLSRSDAEVTHGIAHHPGVKEDVADPVVVAIRPDGRVAVDESIPLLENADPGDVLDPRLEQINIPGNVGGGRGRQRPLESGEL